MKKKRKRHLSVTMILVSVSMAAFSQLVPVGLRSSPLLSLALSSSPLSPPGSAYFSRTFQTLQMLIRTTVFALKITKSRFEDAPQWASVSTWYLHFDREDTAQGLYQEKRDIDANGKLSRDPRPISHWKVNGFGWSSYLNAMFGYTFVTGIEPIRQL